MRPAAILLALASLATVALVVVGGCAPSGPHLEPSGVVTVAGGLPEVPPHTLSAGDQLEIRFPFAPDYNDQVTVGMDGRVAPRAVGGGGVLVGGLTVEEATALLRRRYAAVLRDPELSITVRRYAPEVIYVDGWVAHPGLIRSDLPLTVERAVARAGGVKTGAETGDVLVMRHGVDGAPVETYAVALGHYGGAAAQDPLLKSFDVVYVPKTPIAAAFDFGQQFYANVPFSAGLQLAPVPTAAVAVPAPRVAAPAAAPTPAPVVTP